MFGNVAAIFGNIAAIMAAPTSARRVLVIGAGPSGLVAVKEARVAGLTPVCYEAQVRHAVGSAYIRIYGTKWAKERLGSLSTQVVLRRILPPLM